MNLHTQQLYLLIQHSESFKIVSAIIRIKTLGKSLIMKLSPEVTVINHVYYRLKHFKRLIYFPFMLK